VMDLDCSTHPGYELEGMCWEILPQASAGRGSGFVHVSRILARGNVLEILS
jgi:hypothetical protein